MSADDENEHNMVYMIHYKGTRIMVTGDLLEEDEMEMLEYYRLAMDQGSTDALLFIGYLYECGLGVEQSYETARKYYQEAQDKGNDVAAEYLEKIPDGK